jgi:hypothetical protein
MTDPAPANTATREHTEQLPPLRHIMAARFVTVCGLRFDPDRPVARGRTRDGKLGVDCVVCADIYAGSHD